MAIEVELGEATDEIPASVVFWTHRGDTGPDNDATQQDWIEWMAATFPAEVCQNFVLLPVYRADGRSGALLERSGLPTRKIGPVPVAENCGLCIGRRRIGGRAS